jgi:hypothetical protein
MAQREASHLSQAAQHVSLVRPYSVSAACCTEGALGPGSMT